MKKWYLLIVFICSLSAGFAQLPDLELKDLNHQYVRLKDVRGKQLTVVDFWATWCKPCLASIPKINQLATEFQSKGVAFWGINIDSPRNQSKVKPFVRSMNIGYPVFLDGDQEVMDNLNVSVMPTLLILDHKGKIRFFHEGYQPGDETIIRQTIQQLLSQVE